MKKTKIIFWILNGLFAFMMSGSAIPDLIFMPIARQGFAEMGMPAHLLPFLGAAKMLGVIAILVPGFPRIKEWAYAGLTFDLIGAIWCVAHAGKSVGDWAPMLIGIALAFGAYASYHKLLKAKSSVKEARGNYSSAVNHSVALG